MAIRCLVFLAWLAEKKNCVCFIGKYVSRNLFSTNKSSSFTINIYSQTKRNVQTHEKLAFFVNFRISNHEALEKTRCLFQFAKTLK